MELTTHQQDQQDEPEDNLHDAMEIIPKMNFKSSKFENKNIGYFRDTISLQEMGFVIHSDQFDELYIYRAEPDLKSKTDINIDDNPIVKAFRDCTRLKKLFISMSHDIFALSFLISKNQSVNHFNISFNFHSIHKRQIISKEYIGTKFKSFLNDRIANRNYIIGVELDFFWMNLFCETYLNINSHDDFERTEIKLMKIFDQVTQNQMNQYETSSICKFFKYINEKKHIFIQCLEFVPCIISYGEFIEYGCFEFSDLSLASVLKSISCETNIKDDKDDDKDNNITENKNIRNQQTQISELGITFYLHPKDDIILLNILNQIDRDSSSSIYHIYFDREPEYFGEYPNDASTLSFIKRRDILKSKNHMTTDSKLYYDSVNKEIKNCINDNHFNFILPLLQIIIDYHHILHQDISLDSFFANNRYILD